jgi:prepilin-type N-terminal cleavage/methylation domain-containing protein
MKKCIFVSICNGNEKVLGPLTTIGYKRSDINTFSISKLAPTNRGGFSLLELILVLTIISVLLGVFVSKVSSLQKDAYEASVQLTADSLQGSVRLTHSVWQSQGLTNKIELLEGFGGGNILMGKQGWPIDVIAMNHQNPISAIAADGFALSNSSCIRLWNGLLKDSAPKVVLETEHDNKSSNDSETVYFAQLENGICHYRYRLNQDGLRINYDLATGRVITLF